MSISEAVKQRAMESGQTKADLARASGLDQGSVGRFLRGERGLHSNQLDKLAAAVGIRPAVVLDD